MDEWGGNYIYICCQYFIKVKSYKPRGRFSEEEEKHPKQMFTSNSNNKVRRVQLNKFTPPPLM